MKRRAVLIALTGIAVALAASGGVYAAKKVTIRWLTWDAANADAAKQKYVIDEFQKKFPHIKVQMVEGPWANPEKFLLMLSAGTPPDIIWPVSFEVGWYASKGLLLDLTPLQKSNPLPTDWFNAWKKALYIDGRLYAIPMDTAARSPFYNKVIFDKAGVAYPNGSWTWEDYRQLCVKLTKKSTKGVFEQLGSIIPDDWSAWALLKSFGGGIVSADGKDTALDSPGSMKAARYLREFANTVTGGQSAWLDFRQGKVAISFEGNWDLLNLKKLLKFDYDVTLWPKGPEGRFVSLGNTNWAIPKASKHPKEAWEFIKFASGDWATKYYAVNRAFPARLPFVKYSGTGLPDDSFQKAFIDQIAESGYVEKLVPWLSQARIEMAAGGRAEYWAPLAVNKRTVEDIVTQVSKTLRTAVISKFVKK